MEKDYIQGNVMNYEGKCSYDKFKKYITILEQKRNKFFDYYNSLGIDILLNPVAVYPVPLLEETDMLNSTLYTLVTNFMNMPSGAVPIRLSKEGE